MQLDAVASHQSPLSVILLFVVFVGFSDGIAQGAIFGDVALLPPKYTQVCSPPLIMSDRLLGYILHAHTGWVAFACPHCILLVSTLHGLPGVHATSQKAYLKAQFKSHQSDYSSWSVESNLGSHNDAASCLRGPAYCSLIDSYAASTSI